jgi:3-(3-hydroxy-phenyl)propionate hydroxylase
MLGADTPVELEWTSVYTFRCARMASFRHGRVLFAGDAAHQVSPFGARGANSGLQDVDNLVWKLRRVLAGESPESLLDSYDLERVPAADENIRHSTRATDFITPKSETSRLLRDAVLELAEHFELARPLVNSGRLSLPFVHRDSPLNGPDAPGLPARTRPGAPAVDAPLGDGWLLDRLGDRFQLLAIGGERASFADATCVDGEIEVLRLPAGRHSLLDERYLGEAPAAIYLFRPDQHVAARFARWDVAAIRAALRRASGRSRNPEEPSP